MTSIFMAFIFLLACFFTPSILGHIPAKLPKYTGLAVRACFGLLAFFLFAGTSWVYIPSDSIGLINKIYGGDNLKGSHVVAANGEKGWQADILMPGFHLSPFLTVINQISIVPQVYIPANYYGRIETTDGIPTQADQIMADPWDSSKANDMLDANYFLTKGNGQKGLQASVLKPGRYPINLYLYHVRVGFTHDKVNSEAAKDWWWDQDGFKELKSDFNSYQTEIPAGFVGVIKSNITSPGKNCTPIQANTAQGALTVELVPEGCRGIWTTVLGTGDYYLNRDAYIVTLVDTRLQTLEAKGGYTKRNFDLSLDADGKLTQMETKEPQPFDPNTMADPAVFTKVEGWDVPVELRLQIQILPEKAPIVVASVGGLPEVEKKVLIPTMRSVVRAVIGGSITAPEKNEKTGEIVPTLRATKVLDLIDNRPLIEDSIEGIMKTEGEKDGVEVKQVRLGDTAIPPELLVARRRQQLAGQLSATYEQEKQAQITRQASEAAKATADKQTELVAAQIGVQVAQQTVQKRTLEGKAEEAYLEGLAEGQKAQVAVLGEDKTMYLALTDKVLATLKDKPELIGLVGKLVPTTLVTGSGGADLSGVAAVLGSSLNQTQTPTQPKFDLKK